MAFSLGGFFAMTAERYLHLNQVSPNVMVAMGCNGRGVAMALVMGKVLADWASGTAPQPIPFHLMKKPAVMATVVWSWLRDALK
ncbi:FAD-binding oxidoreductase [Paracoccus liaowanqingii]|uniref:FAD-binding oxidoreductase n=1 Tax=Paracoccus liaowanqingii TaxID=2560053 RepID=A0A4P7HIH6_9RHOB|nr:FAD-binding oxidoreductase [Paracoccus liaowanqingii]QBX33899.1 FAD-binding oxidoreductase [Paracoccus liaowanqingii]